MAAKPKPTGRRRSGSRASRAKAVTPSDPQLSIERIVSAAVELLDEQGVADLSMRKLADRLGAGVMSLYWYVANKEEVLALSLDTVLAYRAPARAVRSADWRAPIRHMLEDWRAGMLRHPWSASLLPRQALGPNVLARLELLGHALAKAGVAEKDMNAAIWSLWNYLMGATITRASFDLSDEERAGAQQRFTELSESYPLIGRSGLLMDDDWDGVFRKGLDFLLEGLSRQR